MMTEQRTATDVLLAIEKQVSQQGYLLQSLDLNIKVLSNKLNEVLRLINEAPPELNHGFTMMDDMNPAKLATAPPQRMQEEEWKPPIPLTTETAPVGERRITRSSTPGMPQPPRQPALAKPAKNVPTPSFKVPEMKGPVSVAEAPPTTGKVPLSQRIVDRNSNSIFKADVEVQNAEGTTIWKGQTGMNGKWQAALEPGKYQVQVRKQSTNQKVQAAQQLVVNDKTPRELPMMIVK